MVWKRDEMINIQKTALLTLFHTELEKQKEHAILWWPICLGFGVSLYFSFKEEPNLLLWSLISFALGTGALTLKKQKKWSFLPLFVLCLISLGITAGTARSLFINAPQIQKEHRITKLEATVEKIEIRENSVRRLLLSDLDIERLAPSQTPHYIRITMRQKQELGKNIKVGDRISVLASLRPLSPPILPHGFDFQRFFYFKHIGGTGFTLSNPQVLETNLDVYGSKLNHSLFLLSESMKEEVHKTESEGNAIAQTFLTGDRALIKEETWLHLRESGLSHMLAISGLHVGLLSATVFFFVRLFLSLFPNISLRFPIKKIAAVAAFCAALFYTLLVGSSVPTVRACIMTGLFFLAMILNRSPFSVHLIASAAFVILLFRPESLISASFQMSFAAVMGLIIFYNSTRSFWSAHYAQEGWFRKIIFYFISVCATTVIATLVTSPFTLYHFQHIAVYGVLGNLLAVPIMAFIVMPMVALTFFLFPLGLVEYPLFFMKWGIETIMHISSWVGSLEGANFSMATLPFGSFCLFVMAGILLLSIRGKFKVIAFIPLFMALIIMWTTNLPDILLSQDGKLWGLYKEQTLYTQEARKGRFIKKQWDAYLGTQESKTLSFSPSGCSYGVCCDEDACRTEINSTKVSFLKRKYSIQTECSFSEIVIAPFYIPKNICHASHIYDWKEFKEKGAHLLWLDKKEGLTATAVEDKRGARSWNMINQK